MIERLHVKDYLIIKESEIEFSNGLNILTGETGAGKSIIIDALSLILGGRADYSLIRKDKEKLIIEGHFNFKRNSKVLGFLADKELDENGGYIIIRRELLRKGISRTFINDTPVSVSDLKALGDIIIDIHSQNEHQSLLNKETHIDILDNYAGIKSLLDKYAELYNEFKGLIAGYEELSSKKDTLLEKKNYIEFQLREINNVNPQENEEEEMENELNKLENIEAISNGVSASVSLLYEEEENAAEKLSAAIKELKKLAAYDNSISEIIPELESAYINIKDSSATLNGYISGLNYDAGRIEEIRERLGSLNFLKKKYNLSVNELITRAKELEEELNIAENFDNEIEQLKKKIEDSKEKLYSKAEELSAARKRSAKTLEKNINSYLKEVGLESAEMKISFEIVSDSNSSHFNILKNKRYVRLGSKGADDVELLIRTNKGMDLSPLKKTASGGEISRVMLSIKASLSNKDNVPILVFDEIDAGISGRIAGKVGQVLKELAKSHQIISITHLPQIAAMSQRHFYISKKDAKNETFTEIKVLNEDEKVKEVAKLISGENITEAAEKSAKELINA